MSQNEQKRQLENLYQEIYQINPELKDQVENDEKWRQDRVNKLMSESGMNKNEALHRAWFDYWQMAKERDGVDFGVFKL